MSLPPVFDVVTPQDVTSALVPTVHTQQPVGRRKKQQLTWFDK